MEELQIFDQNHGLTRLEKCHFFDSFCFFFLECSKTHISSLIRLKQKDEKLPIFNQNHGLSPLEKFQFFDFFKLLFLQTLKEVFLAYFTKNEKNGTITNFLTQPSPFEKLQFFHQNPFGKITIFRLFLTYCFYSLERRFFIL